MIKSIALVLFGFLIGAVTIRVFYPSSESSTPSESVRSQSLVPSDTSDEVRNDLEPRFAPELDRRIGQNESRSEGSTLARNGSSEGPIDATSELVENAVSAEQGLISGVHINR